MLGMELCRPAAGAACGALWGALRLPAGRGPGAGGRQRGGAQFLMKHSLYSRRTPSLVLRGARVIDSHHQHTVHTPKCASILKLSQPWQHDGCCSQSPI